MSVREGPARGHRHESSQRLQGQAATAALYASKDEKGSRDSNYPLDAKGKLTSAGTQRGSARTSAKTKRARAGAATSLKHANPRDLPSFPSVGIRDSGASAGAAASLATSSQKSFEWWKPEPSQVADKAAALAKDYKMQPLWQPEQSAAGSKAALLAAKKQGLSPELDRGYTQEGSRRALIAATGAMSGRKRSGSTPARTNLYPDQANAAANALNAATVAHRPSTKSRQQPNDLPGLSDEDATRIHAAAVTNMGREMYTSHPPVAPEVEEKNRQAGIRAAAISMAQAMYARQQKALESHAGVESVRAATAVHGRSTSFDSDEEEEEGYRASSQYTNLHEAAQKLAAERLAKLHDENAAYRDYYGTNVPPRSRLSIRGRRRSSSEGRADPDVARSRRIRGEMTLFNDKIAEIDAKKRQSDREALLSAAQRNVAKNMAGMDEKIFADTGKASPAMKANWEAKARARAEADSNTRMANHGRVNIGGGKYMDRSDVEAIAAARVQPTLDDISAKAAHQRALDEERRQEEEEKRRIAEESRMEEKYHEMKIKEDWQRFKVDEKQEAKAKKAEGKARKAEEKRLREEEERARKAEKRKSRGATGAAAITPVPVTEKTGAEEPVAAAEERPAVPAGIRPETLGGIDSSPQDVAHRVIFAPVDLPAEDPETTVSEPTLTEPAVTLSVAGGTEPAVVTTSMGTSKAEAEPAMPAPIASSGANLKHDPPPVSAGIAIPQGIAKSTTQTTITGGETNDPTSPTGKVSSWLKSKFSRRSSKVLKPSDMPANGSASKSTPAATSATAAPASSQKEESVAVAVPATSPDRSPHELITDPKNTTNLGSAPTVAASFTSAIAVDPAYASPSERNIAVAGTHPARSRSSSSSTSISSLCSDEPTMTMTTRGTGATAKVGETDEAEAAAPTDADDEPRGRTRTPAVPLERHLSIDTNTEEEEFEEARDHFEEGRSSMPVPSFRGSARASDSPARETRFREDI